jgi:hypothetical protein
MYILSKIDIEIVRLCEKGWSDKNKSESNQQEVSSLLKFAIPTFCFE